MTLRIGVCVAMLYALGVRTGIGAQQSGLMNLWERVTTINRGDDAPRVEWKRLSIHQGEFEDACRRSAQGMSSATLTEWTTSLMSLPGVVSVNLADRTSLTVRVVYREGTRREFDWLCVPQQVWDPAAETAVPRNADGRIQRSEAAKRVFLRQTGYPNGRPGYVVDHVTPLACGGADDPSNMQWQTIEEAKAKDRVERIGCSSPR